MMKPEGNGFDSQDGHVLLERLVMLESGEEGNLVLGEREGTTSFSFCPGVGFFLSHPLCPGEVKQCSVKTKPLETEFKASFCRIWPMSISYLGLIWKRDINGS